MSWVLNNVIKCPVLFQFFLFGRMSLMTHSEGNLNCIGNKNLLVEIMCQTELCLSRLPYRLPVTIFELIGIPNSESILF